MKKSKEVMKTYILDIGSGNLRKITVPSSWKLTFGPTIPYAPKQGYQTDRGYSLRFYEGSKENLRAVFSDVRSFRDESMVISERRTERKSQVVQKQTKQGLKNVVVEASVTEWVNPDAVDDDKPGENEFLNALKALPSAEEY